MDSTDKLTSRAAVSIVRSKENRINALLKKPVATDVQKSISGAVNVNNSASSAGNCHSRRAGRVMTALQKKTIVNRKVALSQRSYLQPQERSFSATSACGVVVADSPKREKTLTARTGSSKEKLSGVQLMQFRQQQRKNSVTSAPGQSLLSVAAKGRGDALEGETMERNGPESYGNNERAFFGIRAGTGTGASGNETAGKVSGYSVGAVSLTSKFRQRRARQLLTTTLNNLAEEVYASVDSDDDPLHQLRDHSHDELQQSKQAQDLQSDDEERSLVKSTVIGGADKDSHETEVRNRLFAEPSLGTLFGRRGKTLKVLTANSVLPVNDNLSSLPPGVARLGSEIPVTTSMSLKGDSLGGGDSILPATSQIRSSTVSERKEKGIAEKEGLVSDNFIRKNMKSKGSSRKLNRSSTRVSVAKQRWIDRQHQRQQDYSKSGEGTRQKVDKPRGLQQWGLDPLELSLDAFASTSASGGVHSEHNDRTQPVDVAVCSNVDDKVKENLDRIEVEIMSSGDELLILDESASDVDIDSTSQCSSGVSEVKAPTVVESTTLDTASMQEKTTSKRQKPPVSNIIDAAGTQQMLMNCAPLCPGHHMQSKLLTVKKRGKNQGRQFYTCAFPAEQRCDFFMWAEDNPEIIKHRSITMPSGKGTNSALSVDGSLDYGMQTFAAKLQSLTKDELQREIYRFNTRLSNYTKLSLDEDTPAMECHALSCAGSAQDMMRRLLNTFNVEQAVIKSILAETNQPLECILRRLLRCCFGFNEFRPGQLWAVERCLQGKRSLLVMPTGAGKSLCYILPSLVAPGLTVVVSPLIALMQDQMRKLPAAVPNACLSGTLTAQEVTRVSEAVLQGQIKVLFVSPERLCTVSFRRLMTLLQRQHNARPTTQFSRAVSLVCIDEAHCLSQWSYNFRPAFLRIRREVAFIKPHAVLALTATANTTVQNDIMNHLAIENNPVHETKDHDAGLLTLPSARENLHLYAQTVESDDEQRQKILALVHNSSHALKLSNQEANHDANKASDDAATGKRHHDAITRVNADHVITKKRKHSPPLSIVYVWRRDEADALASYLKGAGVTGVAVYHAGMDAAQRKRTQRQFDRGNIHCVVATVAFGMGVDKSDVRQVIHSTLPRSLESYTQEIGRAGRDGLSASCHLVFKKEDIFTQHSLAHTNRISRAQVAALLCTIFIGSGRYVADAAVETGCGTVNMKSPTVAIPLELTEKALDINVASIETLVTVLELPPFQLLHVDGTHYDTIKGRFRVPALQLEEIAEADILIAALVALNTIKPTTSNVSQEFHGAPNYDGMEYGLGCDYTTATGADDRNEMGSGWQRDRNAGGSYGGTIQKFQCSRLDIAKRTQLNVEEVTQGLYKLQRDGLLEYILADAALYISLFPSNTQASHPIFERPCSSGQHQGCLEEYHQIEELKWIWRLSTKVAELLENIEEKSADRIISMWRFGCTLGDVVGSDAKDRDVEKQQQMQHLLQVALDCGNGQINCSEENQKLSSTVLGHFNNSTVPFANCSKSGPFRNDSERLSTQLLQQRLSRDVHLLRRDPHLNDIINRVLQRCSFAEQLPPSELSLNFRVCDDDEIILTGPRALKVQLWTVYICRVLHGLPTISLQATTWRQSGSDCAEVWASYRNVSFNDLQYSVAKLL